MNEPILPPPPYDHMRDPIVVEPTPPKRKRNPLVIGGIAAAAVAAVAIPVSLSVNGGTDLEGTVDPDLGKVTIEYSMAVLGKDCGEVENTSDDSWGYDDVPNMEVQVRNAAHEVIGHGALPFSGTDESIACIFSTTIKATASDTYQVGNEKRGYVTWDAGDVKNGVLTAEASLGDFGD